MIQVLYSKKEIGKNKYGLNSLIVRLNFVNNGTIGITFPYIHVRYFGGKHLETGALVYLQHQFPVTIKFSINKQKILKTV